MGVQQISIWEQLYETFRPKKIRLYQFFAGIGAQAQALKELGIEFEDYKIAEWAVPSIKAYNSIHIRDFTDYSKDKTLDEMIQVVKNVSLDYNKPIAEKQLASKSEDWVRDVYNNIIATHNLVNICNVKGKDLEIDTSYTNIIFYSFPCQDLSKAGLRKGLTAERSGLLWEIERILHELSDAERQSCVLICENVPDLVEVNFVKDFARWTMELEKLGFDNYDQILNAKDYCIPQNRRRVFMVSVPSGYSYTFPRKMELQYCLKDFLQTKVDEKYFLSQKIVDFFTYNSQKQEENNNGFRFTPKSREEETVAKTITTRNGSRMDDNFIDEKPKNKSLQETLEQNELEDGDFIDGYNRKCKKDIAGTITTRIDASNNTFIAIKNNTEQGYTLAADGDGVDISGRMQYHRGTVQKGVAQTLNTSGGNDNGVVVDQRNLKQQLCDDLIEQGKVKDGDVVKHSYTKQIMSGKKKAVEKDNEMITLTTRGDTLGVCVQKKENLRIRKLTPIECMRLMGFDDNATNNMKEMGMTDAQIYHVAGDSIVVSVLMGIFGQLLGIDYEPKIRELAKRLAESK